MPTEAEYLSLQAERAKTRLRLSARKLSNELLAPFNVRTFIQSHPWWSVGGAAFTGFLTGRSLRRKRGSVKAGASKMRDMVADMGRRVGRIVTSALGAMAVAGLRGPAGSPEAAPATERATAAQEPTAVS